jgi:agmatine deiminase
MKYIKIIFSLLFFFWSHVLFAQILPKHMTEEERLIMPQFIQDLLSTSRSGNQPPVSPVRAMAEWEEIDGLTITWTGYPSILQEIVRHARLETRVYIICSDSNSVKSSLTAAGVPPGNISFVIAPFNSVWIRDYGQWNVYTNDVDSLLLIDWIYNRPRPNDNAIPSFMSGYLGLPIHGMTSSPWDLIHTGGNWMVDGMGSGFSSNLILDENPGKSASKIDSIMFDFMRVNRWIKMTNLPYDGIHHIDMHMKLLDEETILVGLFPAGVSDGPQLQANISFILNNFSSPFGTPYKIVWVPMCPSTTGQYPPNASYRTFTNAVFINKTILVPTYYPQYDSTALRIYRESLPGYNVVGINCNSIISASGALHCITKEIGSNNPLLITHQPLTNTTNTINPYVVDATIKHRSGITAANIYYRTDTLQPYNKVSMTQTSVPNATWSGFIPPQNAGSVVYYYVEGESVSGKKQVRPIVAPAGYWSFKVGVLTSIGSIQNEPILMHSIFPNPSRGITCISVEVLDNTEYTLFVTDVLGRHLQTIYDGKSKPGEKKHFINTGTFNPGVNFVILKAGNHYQAQKLIIR